MLVLDGVRKGASTAQNTTLGWILSGPIAPFPADTKSVSAHHITTLDTLDSDLRRFWEIDEIPQTTHRSSEETQ